MTAHPVSTAAATATPDDTDRLVAILRAQLEGHGQLQSMLEAKREAIRTADIDRIGDLCRAEQKIIQRLGDLEKHRLVLIGRLTEAIDPRAARPLTVQDIARVAGDERGGLLLELREALRARLAEVGRLSAVIRAASEGLHRHLTGIMQTVQSALSGAATYEQRGRIAVAVPRDHCVDIKS